MIKEKLKLISTKLIGIGALYYATHTDNEKNPKKEFTQQELKDLLVHRIGKTNEQLLGVVHSALPADVATTSLALVAGLSAIDGFDKALGNEPLTIADVNMTNAMLVEPGLWNSANDPTAGIQESAKICNA